MTERNRMTRKAETKVNYKGSLWTVAYPGIE